MVVLSNPLGGADQFGPTHTDRLSPCTTNQPRERRRRLKLCRLYIICKNNNKELKFRLVVEVTTIWIVGSSSGDGGGGSRKREKKDPLTEVD